MAKKRTPEQNKAIYQRRVARARSQGYSGYGQKRYVQEKQHKLERQQKTLMETLEAKFPGIVNVSEVIDMTPQRKWAYDRLADSGLYTPEQLAELRSAHDDFWRIARPMLDRLSA